MKLTQIRNATNRLNYAGKVFLIDPWLAPKHQLSFVDIPDMPFHVRNISCHLSIFQTCRSMSPIR